MTGRLPFGLPPIRSTGAKLAVASIVMAIASAFIKPLGLNTAEVLQHFYVWQPLTYSLTEDDAIGVIFSALIFWSIGGSLEQTWGTRKLLVFGFSITFLAALLTLATSLLVPLDGFRFHGSRVMAGSFWVGYGLLWGQRQTNYFGLPVTGNVLALIGAGFIILTAIFQSPLLVLPGIYGLLMTFVYVKLGFPSGTFERFNAWRLRRQLDKRRAHLNVVSGDKRNMPSDSDRFLH